MADAIQFQPIRSEIRQLGRFLERNIYRFVQNLRRDGESEDLEEIDVFPFDDVECKKWFVSYTWDKINKAGVDFSPNITSAFLVYVLGKEFGRIPVNVTVTEITSGRIVLSLDKECKNKNKNLNVVSEYAKLFFDRQHMGPLLKAYLSKYCHEGRLNLQEGIEYVMHYALAKSRVFDFFIKHPDHIPKGVLYLMCSKGANPMVALTMPKKERIKEQHRILKFVNSDKIVSSVLRRYLIDIIKAPKNHSDIDATSLDYVRDIQYLTILEQYVLNNLRWGNLSERVKRWKGLSPLPANAEGDTMDLNEDKTHKAAGLRNDYAEFEKVALCGRLFEVTVPIVDNVANLICDIVKWWRRLAMNGKTRPNQSYQFLLYADLFEIYAALLQNNLKHTLRPENQKEIELLTKGRVIFSNPNKKHTKAIFERKVNDRGEYVTPRLLDLVPASDITEMAKVVVSAKEKILDLKGLYTEGKMTLESIRKVLWLGLKYRASDSMIKATFYGEQAALNKFIGETTDNASDRLKHTGKRLRRNNLAKDYMKIRVLTSLPKIYDLISRYPDKYDAEVIRAFFSLTGVYPGLINPLGMDLMENLTDTDRQRDRKAMLLARERAENRVRENGVCWLPTNLVSKEFPDLPVRESKLHTMGSSTASLAGFNISSTELLYMLMQVEIDPKLKESFEDAGLIRDHETGKYRDEYELNNDRTFVKHRKRIRSRSDKRSM